MKNNENILERLADSARRRAEAAKEVISFAELKYFAETLPVGKFEFETALKKPKISIIAECKKASPSKGIISKDFPYLKIAAEYEKAGADAISVLTEPTEFFGDSYYLEAISKNVNVPCLRKDFIVDEYMIYNAKILGAKAYLLIVSLLSFEELKRFIALGEKLGISALVETRDEAEIKTAVNAGARIIGVNNRNLKDFSVDINNAKNLREVAPKNVLFVAESGIKTREDVLIFENIGANAVLVGEALMTSGDYGAKVKELRGEL